MSKWSFRLASPLSDQSCHHFSLVSNLGSQTKTSERLEGHQEEISSN